jgi:hypothetical protein
MTVVADENLRVPVPAARPGDRFDLQTAGEGKFLLTRLDSTDAAASNESDAAELRKELVRALSESGAIVGEKPTRDRTYSDRRFHRH